MTTRREFLKSWGPVAGFLAMAASPGALALTGVLPTPCDHYQPVGYLDIDTPGSEGVDYVTVDGERLNHVTRLNDVEGWVEHYGPNPYVDGQPLRPFHRTGMVRVHWCDETLGTPRRT